ncbi:sulfotransferase, partial [Candidatus Pelagibacter sp.]|nr:sulfotransferase [Candidatus Pelagibacter sp.]MDC3087889.1 sulfotransferase [Candidatus Pelagibacter sp.]
NAKNRLTLALSLSDKPESDLIINMALGNLNQQLGDFEEAKKNFNIVNKIDPLNTNADKSISTMHKYLDGNDPHLISMLEKVEKIRDEESLRPLYFALGKAYEDIKDYKLSFKYLRLGNRIADKMINYNIDNDRDLFFEIKRIFKNFKNNEINESKKKIIFILGMPRSGTTLVEQIISSHKEVYGAGELRFMEEIIKKLVNYKQDAGRNLSSYFKNIEDFKYENLKLAQSEYIEKLKTHDCKEKIITDKAPLNFRWVGLIKMIFPNSKVIHCERNGMDTCYSNFKNAFSGASLGFCYDLEKLGNYFNMYKDLMSFWNIKLEDQIYNLSYEKLINNKDLEVKNLLKFCELSWDENCLNPHLNKKTVATASLAQVRTPVYKSSVDKWKNAEDELKDLKKIIL